MRRGLIVPVPKGDKDKSNQDNYRGITLMSVVRKIYEKGLLEKISDWVKQGKIIDDLQGASQLKCSSKDTNWLLRETIAHSQEDDLPVYVCLLDARKAFDSVWQAGLFFKLHNAGMDKKIWRLLMKLYVDFQCSVRVGHITSKWFKALQGIIQGGPFSMMNYQMFNDDLLRALRECPYGTAIGDIDTTSPAFADDVALIATSTNAMQALLDKAYDFSCDWRYEYNPMKCTVVVYGRDSKPYTPLKLGDQELAVKEWAEHVGTVVSGNNTKVVEYIKHRVEACRKPCNAIMGIGSCRAPMTPCSGSKLYWTNCIPKLMYGAEVMNIPKQAMSVMESFHGEAAKMIQGLPDQASNDGAIGCLGWMPLEAYLDMIRLNYFMHLIMLPIENIYKQILIRRYCIHVYCVSRKHLGPLWRFICLCKDYDLLGIIKGIVEDNISISMQVWKSLVKTKVWEKQNQKFAMICKISKTLLHLSNSMNKSTLIAWWKYVQLKPGDTYKCRIIMRLLLDCHKLKTC